MTETSLSFKDLILQGIPKELPAKPVYETSINHAPKRKDSLSAGEKKTSPKKCITLF